MSLSTACLSVHELVLLVLLGVGVPVDVVNSFMLFFPYHIHPWYGMDANGKYEITRKF